MRFRRMVGADTAGQHDALTAQQPALSLAAARKRATAAVPEAQTR